MDQYLILLGVGRKITPILAGVLVGRPTSFYGKDAQGAHAPRLGVRQVT